MLQRIRSVPCSMCDVVVHVDSTTADDPEAPEMIQPPPGAWIGFVRGACPEQPEMIAVCSEACLKTLLGVGKWSAP